jgi:predicted NAD-dependent protein-ADP-ribosyltransferase YbiA (DUF1768 family)
MVTLKELKEEAKATGIKRYSKLNKAELLALLYKPSNDKLYFYTKSKHVAPGKGANEHVEDASVYAKLAEIPDWRKILSNFHVCPFTYQGKRYNSIEHVFQAVKIGLADPVTAHRFTIDSNDPIGLGDGNIAQKHRKLVKLDLKQLAQWHHMKENVMRDAAIAKYKSCPEARQVLLATRNAQLWHIVMRSKPVRFTHLEELRKN